MTFYMGIDIGSSTTKGALIGLGQAPLYYQVPSKADYRQAAQQLRTELLAKAKLKPADITATVLTGRRAEELGFEHQRVTDIICCARGTNHLFPEVRTIVDVQAISSRAIRVSEDGQVINFTVSELCASGCGLLLEVMARILEIDIDEIGPLSLKSKKPVFFTTGCAVFAESEIISRIAEGAAREDILAGVHISLAGRLSVLVERVKLAEKCAVSGASGHDKGLVRHLEEVLGTSILMPEKPCFVTALGAAIMAKNGGN